MAATSLPKVSPQQDYSAGAAFVDGEYVPVSEANISIMDWGFTRSDVTYDVVHVWKGCFFRLEDHLDRFARSCQSLRLDPGYRREQIREILSECVRISGLRDAYVDMICTRGRPNPGLRDPRNCTNRFIAYAVPYIWIFTPSNNSGGPT